MFRIFYKILFTTTLCLTFVSTSFSMDAPVQDIVKLPMNLPEEGFAPYRVKNPGELYALGRYYFQHMGTDYSLAEVKEYYRKLTALRNDPTHFVQYTREAQRAQFNYATIHLRALDASSSQADIDAAVQVMRKAALIGSKDAEEFFIAFGYDS